MAQSKFLSSPYLKARLRPFRQPKLWAAIGIFGLSAFVLVRMFIQPEQFLGKAGDDRSAAANLQANQKLSPEARAIGAELDDLEVLLNEQAAGGGIDAAGLPVSPDQKKEKGKKTGKDKKDPVAEADAQTPDAAAAQANYAQFESLPLVNLNPSQGLGQPAIAGQSSGFSGFNSLSNDSALNLPSVATSQNRGNVTPLQAALDRYVPASASMGNSNAVGGVLEQAIADTGNATANATRAATPLPSAPNASLQNSAGSATTPLVPPISSNNPSINNPSINNPSINNPGLAPRNSDVRATIPSDNAFTQLLNPQLTVPQSFSQPATPPAAPQFQTTPQFQATPQFNTTPTGPTGGNPGLGSAGANSGANSAINPVTTGQSPTFPSPNFSQPTGAPVYQQAAPSATLQRRVPGQNIGGGQINTFSNP